jgi:hypothetical protein
MRARRSTPVAQTSSRSARFSRYPGGDSYSGGTGQWPEHSPERWAAGKAAEGHRRYCEFGEEFVRQCDIVFPGVPSEILMGFALNGGIWENTTGLIEGTPEEQASAVPPLASKRLEGERLENHSKALKRQPFHELGMFGIEGGATPRSGTRS